MSRLGDLIKLERTRQKLTPKQVARKCGVSEKFLTDVEAGTRIIADDQARRILKTMGSRPDEDANFTLEDIASTVDLQSAMPALQKAPVKAPAAPAEPSGPVSPTAAGSIWIDALSGVLRHVPVYNAVMKEVGHRLLPITDGKIEGAPPEKVFYFVAPDNDMRGYRVLRGDLLLVVPAQYPQDDAIMLLNAREGKVLRKVKKLSAAQIMLQKFDAQCESEVIPASEVSCVGLCVRLEAELR